MAFLAIPFFLWYEFWRMAYLCKRIPCYSIQYSFAFFDIAGIAIVKSLYMDVHNISALDPDLADLYYEIAIVYAVYLILPIIIFSMWIATQCKMSKASRAAKRMGGEMAQFSEMADNLSAIVTIQIMAIGNKCMRVLVYLNTFVALVIALASIWANINLFIGYGTDGMLSTFFLAFVFEMVDLVL